MTATVTHTFNSPQPPPPAGRGRFIAAVALITAVLLITIAGIAIAINHAKSSPKASPAPLVQSAAPVAPAPQASTAPQPTASAPAVVAPPPTPSTPKERAVAAAITAFKRYVRAEDDARLAGGNVKITPRSSVTVPDSAAFVFVYSEGVHYVQHGLHQTGYIVVKSATPTSVTLRTDPKTYTVPEVHLRTCLDVTATDAVDRTGKSMVPATRPLYFTTTAVVRYYPQYGGWLVAETDDIASSRTKTC